jgi:hypothetical protein
MKMSILVPVGAIGALAAAVVLASPITTTTDGEPAKAPNRAELYLAATCGVGAADAVSHAASWNNALGSKRALDRALVLASADADAARDCEPSEE